MTQVKIQDVVVGQRFKVDDTWFTMLDKGTNIAISDIINECKFIIRDVNNMRDYVGSYINQAPNDYNGSWVESIIRDYVVTNNSNFYAKCIQRRIDLWDTVGNEEYGTYECYYSAPSLVEYEMYREYIPETNKEWWLCTPLFSRKIHDNPEDNLPFLRKVWAVGKDGVPIIKDVNDVCGVRFCIYFKLDTLCAISESDEYCFLTSGLCTKSKCRFFKYNKCCAKNIIEQMKEALKNKEDYSMMWHNQSK